MKTIHVPEATYKKLAEMKGDRPWGEVVARLLNGHEATQGSPAEAADPPDDPDPVAEARIRELEEKVRTLERGHSDEDEHQDLVSCPTCFAKTTPKEFPAHYLSHKTKEESPKVVKHPYQYGVGYCPECGKVEIRDPGQVKAHLPELMRELYKEVDSPYFCAGCGVPLEDAPTLKSCPACGGTQAFKRKRLIL